MLETNSLATRTLAWRVRHSAWLLAVVLGVGSFSCVGFLYCAARVRTDTWKRRATVVTTLSLIGLVLLLTPIGAMKSFGAGYTAILWLALIGYGFVVDRAYLQWRSAHEPTTPIAAPPLPVVLNTPPEISGTSSEDAMLKRTKSNLQVEAEAPGASTPAAAARLEGEASTPSEAFMPVEQPPVSKYDASQIGAAQDERAHAAVSSWQEAEALAAWHMKKLGFNDAKMTAPGADGGLDVRATDAVAQVKHYATPIGAPVIQQLRGAAHGQGAPLFYSLSGYTKTAVEYADSAAVALFSYDESGVVRPFNHAARILHDRAGGDDAFDSTEFENQAQIVAVIQQYFDVMNAKYIEVAKRALAAANGNNQSPIFRSAAAENARVEAILQSLQANGGRVSTGRLIEASAAIGEAAVRLAEDLQRS